VARKVKQLSLSREQVAGLESGYKRGKSHCYRQRCRMVLLKSSGYSSKVIAGTTGTNEVSVNNWVNRYLKEGLKGLQTKSGRGRKPILEQGHIEIVKEAVQQERQRLSQAKKIIEDNIGRKMSRETLTRFLKTITAVTSG